MDAKICFRAETRAGTQHRLARFSEMPEDEVYEEASKVTAKDGTVVVDGPDHVDVVLTPESAEETADNLIEGAVKARGQRRLRRLPHQPK